MANYYFLISAFPELHLGQKTELTFNELKDLLILNLTPSDLEEVSELLRPIDLYNIRALWLGEPLDDRGNLSAKDLEEELLVRDSLPPYLIDYLNRYESMPDRLRNFASLYASLYRKSGLKGFLQKFYRLEREIRLILTALRSKAAERDMVRELQFEDPYDPMVADILAQKEAPDYTPPREYEDLKIVFSDNRSEPQKLHLEILEYKFKKIEEMEENQDFSSGRVLSYLAKFMLAESYAQFREREEI
jgi:hypothetical protein